MKNDSLEKRREPKSMSTAEISLVNFSEGSNRLRLTTFYFASFVALGLTTGLLGPTLPALATQTNRSMSAISYLFTLRSLGYVIGALKGGRLFDRYSGNTVMGIMLLVAVLMVALVPVSTSLWLLLAVMFLLGVAEASVDVGGNTLLVRVYEEKVAPYMNAMHCFYGVGALIAPVIVAQIAKLNFSINDSYFAVAVLLLPVVGLSFLLPGTSKAKRAQVHYQTNGNPLILVCLAVFLFLYVGAEVGFAGWLFTYLTTTKQGSAAAAAYLTSLFWASLTAGRALLIPVAARVRSESILTASLAGAVASLAWMLIATNSIPMISAATVVLGLSVASIFPATIAFAGRQMNVTGRVTGWFVVGSSLGATTIPLLMGQLLTRVGPRSVIVTPALALLVAGGLFWGVVRVSGRATDIGTSNP